MDCALQAYLTQNKANFDIVPERQAVNADAASVVRVLPLKTEKGYALIVVSTQREDVDIDELDRALGYSVLSLADAKEFARATGISGAIAPVGHSLDVAFDIGLTMHDYIYAPLSDGTWLKIRPEDVIRLSKKSAYIE